MEDKEILTPEDVKELAPLYEDVVLALKQVYDPEIPVNIYDLGLVYELHIDKARKVYIKMTFTAPNCPMADDVIAEVQHSVEDTPGVSGCEIELVWDPVWDQSGKPIIALDDNYITYPHINDLHTKAGNLVDACVNIIIKLHELNLL